MKLIFFSSLLFLISPFFALNSNANEVVGEILTEHSSSYFTNWLVIQKLKKTDCGYAISFDLNQLENLADLAEKEILKKLPQKYQNKWPQFKVQADKKANEFSSQMYSTVSGINRMSKDAQCKFLAGQITGMLSTEKSHWESILYYYK